MNQGTNAPTRRSTKSVVRESDKRVDENSKIFFSACRPLCAQAVSKYNQTVPWHIDPDKFRLALDTEHNTITMKVNLLDSEGHEPDAELSKEDVLALRNSLGRILNRKLRAAKVPFTLGEVTVPANYYE